MTTAKAKKTEPRTVNIHGKDYETTASRVDRFREDEDHKDKGIVTSIIHIGESVVTMKAEIGVWHEGHFQVLATGHAEETRTAKGINSTSALENCETSAIGRALACFGYAGSEFASADEVANAIAQENSRSQQPQISQQNQEYVPSGKPLQGQITEKQLETITKTKATLAAKNPSLLKAISEEYASQFGTRAPKTLSKQEASTFIDYLFAIQKTGKAIEPVEEEIPMPEYEPGEEPF
jgi:hypothetical protein